MYNLIQIQDAIKTVPLKDVMDYANGKNPQIPAYLALSELNRRKQIQETESAFYGQPQDLKTQIESSLTKAPAGVDVTQAPPGQIDITKLPPQFAPILPPVGQVQPGAAPQGQVNPAAPPVMAARGGMMSPDIARGLASIPLSQFKRGNFAGGGIVAFADNTGETAGEAARRQQAEDRSAIMDTLTKMGASAADVATLIPRGVMGAFNTGVIRPLRAVTGADIPYAKDILGPEGSDLSSATPYYDKYVRTGSKPSELKDLPQADYSNEGRAYEKGKGLELPKDRPLIAPKGQNEQASATTSGQIERPAPPAKSIAEQLGTGIPSDEATRAAIARQKMLMREMGIAEDPYAETRKRYEKIEAERAERRKEEPFDRLMEMLGAYSEAAPEKGLGYQLGQAGKASATMRKEQQTLADKQDMEMAGLVKAMAGEEDARKRGDMKAVEAHLAEQEARKVKIIELQQKQDDLGIRGLAARASMVHATRPSQIGEMAELYRTNPELAAKVQGTSKAGGMTVKDIIDVLSLNPKFATLPPDQQMAQVRAYMAGGPQAGQIPTVTSKEQFDKLPSGTVYIGKDGKQYRKP